MLEMAANGAKILHLRCVEYAGREGVPMHVRSSFSDKDGHLGQGQTKRKETVEAPIITGVAHDRSEAKITVVGVPDRPGAAAQIFTTVAEADASTST
jgi:aspartate kinase